MNILYTIYNELFRAGLSREEYRQVREPIAAANRKAIISWSVSMGLFWGFSLVLALFIPVYNQCRQVYIGGIISSAFTLFCAFFLFKKYPRLSSPVMDLLVLSVLLAGIGIAICQPHDRTATMIAVVLMVPTCFVAPTVRSLILLGVTILIYSISGKDTIDPPVYSWGLLNLAIFSVAGIISGHVINKTRFRRYLYEDATMKMAEMQAKFNDKLVLGIATMVDSRDISTGGHSRRTAEGVQLLVEAMRKDETLALTDEFCDSVIKAAPMHDIGKIAVDDDILRKPGKYTPEEYEQMKKHAKKGAHILEEIFSDTEEGFRTVAQNIAHYHHERVDGTGYPEGLKGDEIPLEARIMAIIDVYDALVSKRVYKERYSLRKANRIILDGMGSQFDAKLQKYYEAARPELEKFYAAEREKEDAEARASAHEAALRENGKHREGQAS
ncbi:MAG: HD domain-containing protein [Oscillospiraceae bacterium]|nr:HD domain-containing protein [Oscillospiraceae bacterium]